MSIAGDLDDAPDAPDDSLMNQSDLLNTSRKGKKVGAPRQQAYGIDECIAITRAMIAAKNDPLRGADSKFEDFLSRFKVKYNVYQRKDFPNRSVSSLYDKFKDIRHDCGQFTGFLSKIQSQPRASGATQSEEDDISKVPTFIHFSINYFYFIELSHAIQALKSFAVFHKGKEFKFLSCYHLLKTQPMMSDHTFGKQKKTKPMQLVNPETASALSLQKLTTPITPTTSKLPAATVVPAISPRPWPPVTPMRLAESMKHAAPPPPRPPSLPLQTEIEDTPAVFNMSNDGSRSDSSEEYEWNDNDWNDGFAFLDESQFKNVGEDLSQALESSILDATTTTPVVESTSEVDTSASTIRLNRSQKRTLTVVSNVAESAIDGHQDVAPLNSEADLGAPGNLIGVKRAKRIRALERETEIIKTSVGKIQRTHDAILSHCLAAAKDEAEKQLQDCFYHWCQFMGADESDMQRFEHFRSFRNRNQLDLESQMVAVRAGDDRDEENWMENDLFGGAHVQ